MDDLGEKNGNDFDGTEAVGRSMHDATPMRYQKLSANLMLLYQAYLQKETLLEPEIKATFWRMVQFQEGFPMKIRMMQLELLSYETDNFDGEWDAVKDNLFPLKDEGALVSLSAKREEQLQEYKEVIFQLLGNPS